MNLLGKMAMTVASKVALDATKNAIVKASKKNRDKFFEKQPGTEILVISKNELMNKDTFDVYDENREVKYNVKGNLTSIKHHLRIYDAKGNEIGMIKEQPVSMLEFLFCGAKSVDLIIEINGKKRGKFTSTWSFGKPEYEVDFNGWRIEKNIWGWEYKVLKGNREIAHISQKVWYFDGTYGDTYVVAFPDIKNELIVLMLVLSLYVANQMRLREQN